MSRLTQVLDRIHPVTSFTCWDDPGLPFTDSSSGSSTCPPLLHRRQLRLLIQLSHRSKSQAPEMGAYVAKYTNVAITHSATDNVKVSKVEVRVNGVLKCTLSTAPYTCYWRVPDTRGVAYDIKSKAYDSSGNKRWSPTVRVISY